MSTLTAETTTRGPNTRRSMVSFDLSQHTSSSDFMFHPPSLSRNSTASPPPSPMLSTPTDSTFADDSSVKKPRPMSMPPLMMDIDDEPPDYLESVIHLHAGKSASRLFYHEKKRAMKNYPLINALCSRWVLYVLNLRWMHLVFKVVGDIGENTILKYGEQCFVYTIRIPIAGQVC